MQRHGARWCGIAALALSLSLVPRLLAADEPSRAKQLGLELPPKWALAPEFTLPDPAGGRIGLSQFRGKLVFLNFWATWCPPCREEMPAMEKLSQAFRDKGLVVLAVNFQEGPEAARVFFREQGLTYPVVLDQKGNVALSYGVRGLPATYFIGRDGQIVARAFGPRDWAGPDARRLITALLDLKRSE